MTSDGGGVRTRDPDRRVRILRVAADLLADRGFHGVSMADIGGAAGIVGSGVYRHFDSKSAVLVALLDDVMDRLLQTASTAGASGRDEREVLADLVHGQVLFAVDDRALLQLYQREVHSLPDADRRRLRRLQRHYVEEWVHVLAELRPELTDAVARASVHAAIGAVQSVATYDGGLPRDEVVALLTRTAYACLGVEP
ncbi:TetR family transcriptional regulator [Geodermatophilus sp. Leaf369]|uniref:TetR/AcrR family transcriptional regulator n=1 Tax=Geodermatophilus sp. Leaf369 TaxID=1736354 RepID=UPI0006F6847F|nr:TetR/AcrR family transcriptional regulator [Geodermatophilus sp. Leaf369]KQS60833.1 TetR family transcriptional regulator [Geodermatophilus sp. Leaf369]QNG37071.1 TetR/AcrR family transcriptional regulator [Geodermatophilaceae bacterium NBWT11]